MGTHGNIMCIGHHRNNKVIYALCSSIPRWEFPYWWIDDNPPNIQWPGLRNRLIGATYHIFIFGIFLRPKFQGISPENMDRNMVQYFHFWMHWNMGVLAQLCNPTAKGSSEVPRKNVSPVPGRSKKLHVGKSGTHNLMFWMASNGFIKKIPSGKLA